MNREKIRRKDKIVKVDKNMVRLLKKYRAERNCSLYPDPNKKICFECSHFKECKHFEWERDFIHSEDDAKKTSAVRKKKKGEQDNKNRIFEQHFEGIEDVEDIEDDENVETDANAKKVEVKDDDYPCHPFDFGCPKSNECDKGNKCPWKKR